ncbi:hypothetical protein [Chryseobacterium indologenes]|uniref:Uncharacterized protein n=1 Tax=Chryseobacterium indologenes TaxID=253 RepID=A0A0N0ITS5_CHRID|nr:hypothetical protein [Chryseobacterium indologenes]KPE49003.1 hypothetical protein AOB46_22370 [Chryseobacterium indologenes]
MYKSKQLANNFNANRAWQERHVTLKDEKEALLRESYPVAEQDNLIVRDIPAAVKQKIIILNAIQFEDTPSGEMNQEIKEVLAGRGSVRTDAETGLPQVYENRKNSKKERTWAGSIEYNVPSKKSGDKQRILKKTNNDGTTTYGYTLDHYETIHKFKEKNK